MVEHFSIVQAYIGFDRRPKRSAQCNAFLTAQAHKATKHCHTCSARHCDVSNTNALHKRKPLLGVMHYSILRLVIQHDAGWVAGPDWSEGRCFGPTRALGLPGYRGTTGARANQQRHRHTWNQNKFDRPPKGRGTEAIFINSRAAQCLSRANADTDDDAVQFTLVGLLLLLEMYASTSSQIFRCIGLKRGEIMNPVYKTQTNAATSNSPYHSLYLEPLDCILSYKLDQAIHSEDDEDNRCLRCYWPARWLCCTSHDARGMDSASHYTQQRLPCSQALNRARRRA